MAWYRILPGASIVYAPLAIVAILAAVAGAGSLLAALNVAYRDFRYTLTFLLQAWMFATPAIYLPSGPGAPLANGSEVLSEAAASWLDVLNPINGNIRFFRAAFLGDSLPWTQLSCAAAGSALLLTVGLIVFRRTEDSFADII
jgi:lipopolysaccharide transport system permease protein